MNNAPKVTARNVSQTGRLLLFFSLLLFPSLLSADSPVSISILSILQPAELTVTLRDPDRAMLQSAVSRTAIAAHVPVRIQLRDNRLMLDSNISVESMNIDCPNSCVLEIMTPGMPAPRRYQGNLRLTTADSTINVVLQISEAALLASIIASEMGEYRDPVALRAFAIVSRSFLHVRGRHPELMADFCDLTHCQVFQSYSPSSEARNAAHDTAGLILKYRNRAFRPYYSRSCGGTTATFEEVWGKKSPDYPFTSTQCSCNTSWKVTLNAAEAKQLFGSAMHNVIQQDNTLTVNGRFSFRLEEFRILAGRVFGWKKVLSNSFRAKQQGHDLVIEGKGIGHRVGFCQNGAFEMSKEGSSYQKILQHYFPNTEIRSGS